MEGIEQNEKYSASSLIFGVLSIIIPVFGLILGIFGLIISWKILSDLSATNVTERTYAVSGVVCSLLGMSIQLLIILAIVTFRTLVL